MSNPNKWSLTPITKAFGNSVQFWLGLQDEYELHEAKAQLGDALDQIARLAA